MRKHATLLILRAVGVCVLESWPGGNSKVGIALFTMWTRDVAVTMGCRGWEGDVDDARLSRWRLGIVSVKMVIVVCAGAGNLIVVEFFCFRRGLLR